MGVMMADDKPLTDKLSAVLAPVSEALDKAKVALRMLDTEIMVSTQQSSTLAENERGLRNRIGEMQAQVTQMRSEMGLLKDRTQRELAAARSQAQLIVSTANVQAAGIRKSAENDAAEKVASVAAQHDEVDQQIKNAEQRLRELLSQCDVAQHKLERIKSAAADFAKA